jgi:hypothetical protein
VRNRAPGGDDSVALKLNAQFSEHSSRPSDTLSSITEAMEEMSWSAAIF